MKNTARNFWIDMQPATDRRILWTEQGTPLDDELFNAEGENYGRYLLISEERAYEVAKSGLFRTSIIKPHGLTPDWTDDTIKQYLSTDDGTLYY